MRSRRTVLAGAGALAGLLSGCIERFADEGTGGDGGDDGGDDETATATETPSGFRVAELDYASGEPADYDDYEPQPEDTYEPGATVWFYLDVHGATAVDGTVHMSADFTVRPPDGTDYEPSNFSETYEFDLAADETADRTFLAKAFALNADVPEGEYPTTVTVTDENAAASDAVEGSFRVLA
jgi:hypothetical protein